MWNDGVLGASAPCLEIEKDVDKSYEYSMVRHRNTTL